MRRLVLMAWIGAIALTGCSGGKQSKEEQAKPPESTGQPAPSTAQQTPPPVSQTPQERPVERRPAPEQARPAAPPAPSVRLVTIPVGSKITVALAEKVSTATDKPGTTFKSSTLDPVMVNGITVVPAGASVGGEVTFAKRASRIGGKAQMTVEFKDLTLPEGKTYPLAAKPLTMEGKGTGAVDLEKVAGGAVGGAILGGILGGKKGALEGAAAGGIGGGVWAVATRGNDIVLDPNQKIEVTLTRDLKIPVTMPAGAPNP